jgi:antirestriction protein ArdC
VRKGEHETKVYFVKQLRVRAAEGEDDERLVPMLREYTVFNVAQCEGLPASIIDGKPARVRNPDTRDRRARRAARPLSKQTSEKTNNIAWRPRVELTT